MIGKVRKKGGEKQKVWRKNWQCKRDRQLKTLTKIFLKSIFISLLRRVDVFCGISVHCIFAPQVFVYGYVVFTHLSPRGPRLPRCNMSGDGSRTLIRAAAGTR
jgi:hypothetical protein